MLTEAERVKFADYLELEADSNEQLAAEMGKTPSGLIEALAKKYRMEAAAMRLVANRLRATESQAVSS